MNRRDAIRALGACMAGWRLGGLRPTSTTPVPSDHLVMGLHFGPRDQVFVDAILESADVIRFVDCTFNRVRVDVDDRLARKPARVEFDRCLVPYRQWQGGRIEAAPGLIRLGASPWT